MEPQAHPDPSADAAGHEIQRIIQTASSAATSTQVIAYVRQMQLTALEQLEQEGQQDHSALADQLLAERAAARAGLAALHDPRWLRTADLRQAAQAWGTVLPFTDPETSAYYRPAVTAMRHAEERLRVLHPTAMGRYDRLRSDGLHPAEAMRQAAPMFSYPPRAHDPPHTPPPPTLATGTATTPAKPGPDTARDEPASAAPPWQHDFPAPIDQVLAATAQEDSAAAAPSKPAVPAPGTSRAPKPGRES